MPDMSGILQGMQKRWKQIAAFVVLLTTLIVFIVYVSKNPAVIDAVRHLPPQLLIALLGLYAIVVFATALIFIGTARLCNLSLHAREGTVVTAYSAIINFFGPLQSGPAFRAIYLKQKYGTKLLNYTTATMVYYLLFALMSGLCLLSGMLGWWLVPLTMGGVAVLIGMWYSKIAVVQRFKKLHLGGLGILFIATFLQVFVVSIIYYLELNHVSPGISYSQAIIYTGAANFALFVSLTPGAIGFREAFLVFSQNLHHISNDAIVSANIIDRGVYLVVLAVLAAVIFGSHAQQRLGVKRTNADIN
jgi:uncharacterized membrane protein YbhN (UPF0104 family)